MIIRFVKRWFGGTKRGLRYEIERLKEENKQDCRIANKQIRRMNDEQQASYDEIQRLHKENIQKSAAIRELVSSVEQANKDHVYHAYDLLRNISLREAELRPGGHDTNRAETKIEALEGKIADLKVVVAEKDSCIKRQQDYSRKRKLELQILREAQDFLLDGYDDGDSVPSYRTMKEGYIAAITKIELFKVRLANCGYFAEQFSGSNASETVRLKNLIMVEARLGADAKRATNYKTGEVYKGPVAFESLPESLPFVFNEGEID